MPVVPVRYFDRFDNIPVAIRYELVVLRIESLSCDRGEFVVRNTGASQRRLNAYSVGC